MLVYNFSYAETLRDKMASDDLLKIERVGGLAGYGLPGSHLRSYGEIYITSLTSDEIRLLNAMFHGERPIGVPKTDGFLYRITMKIGGESKTIVIPEEDVPIVIQNCVKDSLE